jgi:DNA repair protein RadA/Sms
MAKQKTFYICQNCGAQSPKWQGQCFECGKWNTLVEETINTNAKSLHSIGKKGKAGKIFNLKQIKTKAYKRDKTKILELDRVLGGGIVPGSVVLVAGEPGIGKSTLLTQLAVKNSNNNDKNDKSILYVCGEESPHQIKRRIERISKKTKTKTNENLLFLAETSIEDIISTIKEIKKPLKLIIVDSIQTLWTERLTGAAGSVGQVRECSNILLNISKKTNIPIFLIGHVTKQGAIAGPKVLEHIVDTVLYLEGDKQHDFRILRTSKNRFGPTDEVGIFQMTDKGMKSVLNPADIFLQEDGEKNPKPGSAIVCSMQGIRPMLVEIQALVVNTQLAIPRRVASGINQKKLQVLVAVLQKKLGLPLHQYDIFVNVAGGLKLREPAIDLGICMAVASSLKNKPLLKNSVCIGEVGLLGEIRKVSFMDKRIKEAKKMGYKIIIGDRQIDLRQMLKFLK